MSDEPWIVELVGGVRQSVRARSVEVTDGHLIASTWEGPVAAWAPEVWARFWRRPDDRSVETTRARLAAAERLLEREEDDITKIGLTQYRDRLRETLAEMESQQAGEPA